MKMSNNNNCGMQWHKTLIGTSLLLTVCSFTSAKSFLPDHQLSELTSNSRNLDLQSIQRALISVDQPLEKQKQESAHFIALNVESIQPQSISEAVVLDYQLQKEKRAEQVSSNEKKGVVMAIIRLVDTDDTSDNFKRYHDDGITVEIKR
jgi:hypothetical protein